MRVSRPKVYFAVMAWIIAHALLVPAAAETFRVNSDLQGAIDAASDGDTIEVGPGLYEKISIGKRLTLIGHDSIIRTGGTDACISVDADGVVISGFIVREGLYGIRLTNAKGCNINNNTVIHCKQPGIALLVSDGNVIERNNASYNGLGGEGWYGIYLSNSNDNLIRDNVACNNGAYGIDMFPSCNNNTIVNNILDRNMYGLYMFTDCAYNRIEGNVMNDNKNSGLDMRLNCHDNLVLNNTMKDNVVVGISLLDSGGNTLNGNAILGNGNFGIQIQGGDGNNTVRRNNISGSSTGIYVDSMNNKIYGNRLFDNVISAQDRSKNFWNEEYPTGGNAWGDYSGSDEMSGESQSTLGADGIGDTPYVINERASDRYPIMGELHRPIKVIKTSIDPASANVGQNIDISLWMDSANGLSMVSIRVPEAKATGFVLMKPNGDHYSGQLITALMDPGKYSLVLTATDKKGFELVETIGEFQLSSRKSRSFDGAMSKLGSK